MTIHIGEVKLTDVVDVVFAKCGATGIIMPDASLHPDDFDFVGSERASNATCPACIVNMPVRERELAESVE